MKFISFRLLLIGSGLMEGDFKEEERVLKDKIANIEPLVESQLQIIIQAVIVYTITFENQIDLSSLLYSDTTSKITYFLMLLSSLVSICITFTKMLQIGHEPAISSVFTARAGMIFVFLVTKFLLLSYCNSLAITSMMLGSVGGALGDGNPLHDELFEHFYRGLCTPSEDPLRFCGDQTPLTLYSATRILPIMILFLLYFPPLLFLIILNIKRGRTLSYENVIHLIFPLVTNLSFYGPIPNAPKETMKWKRDRKRANTMPSIHQIENDQMQTKRERAKSLSCLQHLKTDPEEMKFGIESEKVLLRQKTEPMSYRSDMTSYLTDIWLSDGFSDEEFIMKLHQLSTKIDKTVPKRYGRGPSYKVSHCKRRRFSLPKGLESRLVRITKDKNELQFSLRESAMLYAWFLYPAITICGLDVVMQIINMKYNQCKRTGEECGIEGEMTVLDLLMKVDPINQVYMVVLVINIIAFVSFAISLKRNKGRSSCRGLASSRFLQEMIEDW